MRSPRPHRSLVARARRRRQSRGAALFIVAVTLGLLAAMGVYGLSATAYDVRAAGHAREAIQMQHAAEQAVMMSAEALSAGSAGTIVRAMQADPTMDARMNKVCKTAKPPSAAGSYEQAAYRIAEACLIVTPNELSRLHPLTAARSADPNPLQGHWVTPAFNKESFGALHPFVQIELTNPIDWETPPGFATSAPYGRAPIFTQIRATVFVQLKPGADLADARANHPAQTVATGRGRLVVGPYIP